MRYAENRSYWIPILFQVLSIKLNFMLSDPKFSQVERNNEENPSPREYAEPGNC
jgi:hypothetical protein